MKFQDAGIPALTDPQAGDYLKAREIPKFSLKSSRPQDLALDYLTEDPAFLLECLRYRIQRWGELVHFLDSGGYLQHIPPNWKAKAQEKISILALYQKLFQQGRSRPLPSEQIAQENAVSINYQEKIREKLEEYNHDPALLLEALRRKEVQGFRTNKITELEESLQGQGFLPANGSRPQPLADINQKIKAEATGLQFLEIGELEQFLKKVLGESPPS